VDPARQFRVDLEDLADEAVLPVGGLRPGVLEHQAVLVDPLVSRRSRPAPGRPLSQLHIRMLLGQLDLGPADLDMLAIQLTAALDGPLLLYLSAADLAVAPDRVGQRITQGWQDLIRRVARP